jgi:hypothetical protein
MGALVLVLVWQGGGGSSSSSSSSNITRYIFLECVIPELKILHRSDVQNYKTKNTCT